MENLNEIQAKSSSNSDFSKCLPDKDLGICFAGTVKTDSAAERFRRHAEALRLAKIPKMSRAALAKESGLQPATVSDILNGKQDARMIHVDAIAAVFGRDVSEFFAVQLTSDLLRPTRHVKLRSQPGGVDVDSSPTVKALRALIDQFPQAAAEAFASVIESGAVDSTAEKQPARPQHPARRRHRTAKTPVKPSRDRR